jgi:hypothetical protein
MTAIDFPNSPEVNDTHVVNGVTYTWDGTRWKASTNPVETDPVFTAHVAYNITGTQITNWDTAFGWGNHASVGYLTSETSHADVLVDGDFTSQGIMLRGATAGSYSILTDNSANWNTAHGWGDHASAGYAVASSLNISNWDTAFGWGDHASAGYATADNTMTLTNKTLGNYREGEFTVTGTTPALSPANGPIQSWTLTANSTPTAGTWNSGESITLLVDDGAAHTINWGTLVVEWQTDGGTAPLLKLTNFTNIVLWKVGSIIYGARVGDA